MKTSYKTDLNNLHLSRDRNKGQILNHHCHEDEFVIKYISEQFET